MIENKGIIFAADIEEKGILLRTIDEVLPYVEGIKVGNIVLYSFGWAIIKDIKAICDKPILVDLKLMDIPYIAKKISTQAYKSGADGIIVCGPIGKDSIMACKDVLDSNPIFVFTQFTHSTGLINDDMAQEYVKIAMELGCNGVQIPANRPDRIVSTRSLIGDNALILSCGVGAQGTPIGDAIKYGADYEIIGRAIYKPFPPHKSPLEAAISAKQKISNVLYRLSLHDVIISGTSGKGLHYVSKGNIVLRKRGAVC